MLLVSLQDQFLIITAFLILFQKLSCISIFSSLGKRKKSGLEKKGASLKEMRKTPLLKESNHPKSKL